VSYAKEVALAKRLIRGKGTLTTVTRPSTGYDPVTGASSSSPTISDAYAVAKVPRGADAERIKALDIVSLKTVLLLIAADGMSVIPAAQDVVAWAGEDYTIRDVATLAPDGGTDILYDVVASR